MTRIKILLLAICSLFIAGVIGYKDYLESKKLYFSIEMEASASGISQIYFDTGHGYNGVDTIEWQVKPSASRKYSFPLPAVNMKSIRFDPTRSTSVISIKKAGIENAKGELLKNFPIQSFRSTNQISKMDVSEDVLVIHTTENANDPITEIENSSVNGKTSWADFFVQRGWLVVGYTLLSFIMFMGLAECIRLVKATFAKPEKVIGKAIAIGEAIRQAIAIILTKASEKTLFVGAFIIVLAAMQVLPSLKTRLDADRGAVRVDMEVNVGGSSNMYVNTETKPPIRVEVLPNVRKVHEFAGLLEDIHSIRFDPAAYVKGATIRIYNIEIQSPTGGTQRIGPGEIAEWRMSYGRRIALTDNYIEFVSTDNIQLDSTSKYHVGIAYPAFVHNVVSVFFDLSRFRIIVVLYLLCLVFASFWIRSWAHVAIVSTMFIGIISLSQSVTTANFGSISVDKTVGLAAYAGHPVTPNKLFIALTTLLAGIAAGAAYYLTRKRLQSIQSKPLTSEPRSNWWQFGILFILVAAYIFPDITNGESRWASLWSGYIPQWDTDNAITWGYMIKNGYVPFRDFWYPYALSFAFDLISPWGDLLQYLVLLGLYGAFIYFISIVSRSAYVIGSILTFAILLGLGNWFPQPERHLFPFVICLTYIAASGNSEGRQKSIWPFWFATCVALLFETSQIAYAALGIGLVLLIDTLETWPIQWRSLSKRLTRDFAVPSVFLCVVVIVLTQFGISQNISDMYFEMGTISNYMAMPTSLNFNGGNIAGINFFLVTCPFVILALGIYERFLAGNANDFLSKAIMAVGAIGVMQLQKHSVRPIDWALFYSTAIGLVLYSKLLSRRLGRKIIILFGGMLGLTATVLLNIGIINQAWQRLVNTGPRVSAAAHVLAMDSKELADYRAYPFSPARMKVFSDEVTLLNELKYRVGYMPTLYSLTDDPILYVMEGAKPPYQINGFSTSPIFEQNKIVDYLQTKKIEYVIVEPGQSPMDGVPYSVRLPVLYSYVVSNYTLDFVTKRFSVFRLRKPSELTSLDAWKSALGDTVQLGHLPVYSAPPESPSLNCESDCEEILKVTLNKTEQEQLVTIPFMVNDKALGISFVAVPGKMEYWIKLNRIWFWAAQSDGVTLARLGQILPAGTNAQIYRSRLQLPERLY